MHTDNACKQHIYKDSTFSTVHFGTSHFTSSDDEGGKALTVFKIDTSVSGFPSHSAASTAMKGLK